MLSEDMAGILNWVTTSFRRPFVYRTVSRDRRAQVCTIPGRCVWWVAKVEGAGDDQVFNRMFTCWIGDSEEQDARVLTRVLARAEELPANPGGERPEAEVCQAMWEMIGQRRFHFVIPFAQWIRFQAAANRRKPTRSEWHPLLMHAGRVTPSMTPEENHPGEDYPTPGKF